MTLLDKDSVKRLFFKGPLLFMGFHGKRNHKLTIHQFKCPQ